MSRTDELRMMARVAQLYHEDASSRRRSRSASTSSQATVSRLLKRAEEEGVVRVTIVAPRGTYPANGDRASPALQPQRGDRRRLFRGPRGSDPLGDRRRGGATISRSTLSDGDVIGISSWSASLLRMVDAIRPMKRPRAERVVQILGGLGNPAVQSHATQLTTRLAMLTGAEAQLLPAQGVVWSSAARLVMLGDAFVRAAMDQFRRMTIALVGIGALQPSRDARQFRQRLHRRGGAAISRSAARSATSRCDSSIKRRRAGARAARRAGDRRDARRTEANAARRRRRRAARARSRRSAPV